MPEAENIDKFKRKYKKPHLKENAVPSVDMCTSHLKESKLFCSILVSLAVPLPTNRDFRQKFWVNFFFTFIRLTGGIKYLVFFRLMLLFLNVYLIRNYGLKILI